MSRPINRRDFIATAAAATATLALAACGRRAPQATGAGAPMSSVSTSSAPVLPDGFVSLRRNTGIYNGRGGTIGWLATPDALAIVDTQFPDTAAACLAGLPARGDRMIDVVINTHHHGDHTSGNPVFRPVAKRMVAHANVPALQRAAAARATPPTLDKQVYADTTFAGDWRLELPGPDGETLRARHFGPGHTGGDIIVLFEKANVVHMGDLVFNRIHPVIDRIGGASIKNWIHTLETVSKTYPADAIYVFGHGNPAPNRGVTGTRADLLAMRDYLAALLEYTRTQIAAGRTRAEITTLPGLPGFAEYDDARTLSRLPGNFGVAHDELTAPPANT